MATHITSSELDPSQTADLQAGAHSMLGMGALLAEMQALGVPPENVLRGTGLAAHQFTDPRARMSHEQKMTIYGNVHRLSPVSDIGLRAGARQRMSDFGIYGYALVSSPSFGEAIALGVRHVKLAGPVLEKRFRVEGDTAIFEALDVMSLGELLPLCTEYWFATIHRLITCVLEHPLTSRVLLLPYPKPPHAAAYERTFGCPVRFEAGRMEWHFDATQLDQPLPNANPITAELCAQLCERMSASLPEESDIERSIRSACFNSCGDFPTLDEMAHRLGLSPRTLQRRLTERNRHYHDIVDEVRASLATDLLTQTTLSVEEVGQRVGFSEASNFRKAFRKWTGRAPSEYRSEHAEAHAA